MFIKRILFREKHCIICKGSHKDNRRCLKCKRYSGKDCIAEAKEQGLDVCLFCGSKFEKEIVEFEPRSRIDMFDYSAERVGVGNMSLGRGDVLGSERRYFETDVLVSDVMTPNEIRVERELEPPVWNDNSFNEQARACVSIDNNTIEPLELNLNYNTDVHQVFELSSPRVTSGRIEVSGEMTVMINDDTFNSLNFDNDTFTVRYGDRVIENCIIEEFSQDMTEGELSTATIRFRGVAAG